MTLVANAPSAVRASSASERDALLSVRPLDTRVVARRFAGPCVPVAFGMIARAYGLLPALDDTELIDELATVGGTPRLPVVSGTPQEGKVWILEHLGLAWSFREGFDPRWLSEQLRAGHLVVAGGKRNVLPNARGEEGHAIVVNGVSADGATFFVSDSTGLENVALTAAQLRSFIERRPGGAGTCFAVQRPQPTPASTPWSTEDHFVSAWRSRAWRLR